MFSIRLKTPSRSLSFLKFDMSDLTKFKSLIDVNQLAAIGMVTTIASFNDYLLDTLICDLMGVPVEKGRIALTKVAITPKKCQIITTLIENQWKNDLAIRDWKKLARQIGRTAERRADLVHGLWTQDNGGKWYVFRYKTKDKGAGTKIKMGIKDITDIQKKLYQAGLELMNWIIRYRKQTALAEALMQSSPDKSA